MEMSKGLQNWSFNRLKRLPPYVLSVIRNMMIEARRRGDDIVDLGMGNPDIPTPAPVVEKLIEAARNPRNHRYSVSRGIRRLREEICAWYKKRYGVDLDPETEAIVTIGAKEGISHLVLATIDQGDLVFVTNPAYPIHIYAAVIAGGDVRTIPMVDEEDFFEKLESSFRLTWPKPKMIILNYPNNPTTRVVDIEFFSKIVDFARENGVMVVHDFAYADIAFDGYKPPSFLQAPGAKEVGVEIYSMSKSFSMAGWRVGFVLGNSKMVEALARVKSYFDYGMFQPIQIASIIALRLDYSVVQGIASEYAKRRDVLVRGLNSIGWKVEKPRATMFVWAKIPEGFKSLGSLEFCKLLLKEAKVAVSPGVGFGEYGEGYVRFALVENEHRIRQALKGIRKVIKRGINLTEV